MLTDLDLQPHIRCSNRDAAEYAILPGDPGRVGRVKQYLENIKEVAFNREFKTITGYYKGVKVMVTSTGVGGPSTAIAVEELRRIGVKTFIRIGSCGALKSKLKLGDLILASGAVRDEGTSSTYIEKSYPAVPDTDVLFALVESANESGYRYHTGVVRSHDSFYTDGEDSIDKFWSNAGVLGSDMETSALFVVGRLRGLRTASILNVVVEYNADLEGAINNYVDGENRAAKGEENEILTALEAIVKLENNK